MSNRLFAGAIEDFNGASGLAAADISTLITTTATALMACFALWLIVATFRRWSIQSSDMGEAVISLLRVSVLLVLVATVLGLAL